MEGALGPRMHKGNTNTNNFNVQQRINKIPGLERFFLLDAMIAIRCIR